MKHLIATCVFLTMLSSFASAQGNLLREELAPQANSLTSANGGVTGSRYACSHIGIVRRIEIEYETTTSTLPCSVNYFKDTEAPGYNATLWRAEVSEGYCESKAAEFADKLRAMGWSCTES